MENRVFKYGSHSYEYNLERSSRKTFSLVIFPNLKIVLKVPNCVDDESIEKFLVKKWVWLDKQLKELEKYKKAVHERKYVSGENYYYLGRQYMLLVQEGNVDGAKVAPGTIFLTTTKSPKNLENNRKIYEKWYIEKCETVFKKELFLMVKKYDIKKLPKLKIREMKSRWGSYQKNGTINLNPKLLQASRATIDYVITHELCHIEFKNHDEKFYELLESRIPEWRRIKEELELRFG